MQDKIALIEKVYQDHFGLFVTIGYNNYRLPKTVIDDIIQQTFVRAIKRKETIKGTTVCKVRSFLVAIFRHCCIDYIRTSKFDFLSEDVLNQGALIKDNHLESIIKAEEKKFLQREIAKLKPKYQTPLVLFLEGYSQKEIAKKTGVNYSTIRSRIERGLNQLKKNMNKQ